MEHLETEGTFWRSTYLFSCSYLEWLYSDHFSWYMSLTYLPSFRRISSLSITALRSQGQRSRRVPVSGSQANWVRRKRLYLHLVIAQGPLRRHLCLLALCSCSADFWTAHLSHRWYTCMCLCASCGQNF